MKPTLLQRFFASKWALRLWFCSSSLATTIYCLNIAEFRFNYVRDWHMAVTYLLVAVTAVPLGFMLGVFPGCIFLGFFFKVRSIMNGGPFKPGDTVQIIGGNYDGKLTQVYSDWQGNSLRLELGEDAKREFKDIFEPTQLLKIPNRK